MLLAGHGSQRHSEVGFREKALDLLARLRWEQLRVASEVYGECVLVLMVGGGVIDSSCFCVIDQLVGSIGCSRRDEASIQTTKSNIGLGVGCTRVS